LEVVRAEELAEGLPRLRGGLSALGLRRGDVLALWMPNVRQWLQLYLAASSLGITVAAVNTRYRSSDVAHLLRAAKARAIAYLPDFKGIDFAGILDDTGAVPEIVITKLPDAEPVEESSAPDELAILFTTSGTTSSPKLAAHSLRSVRLHAERVGAGFDIHAGDVMLAALPLAGTFGFSGVMAALAAGAAVVLQPVFDADEAAAALSEHGVTHFNGSDAMLKAVLDSPELNPDRLRWRGGGFANFSGLASELVARGDEVGVRLYGLYGSSECFALMARWAADDPPERRRLAGGRPLSGIEVREIDGELQVRGYNVMAGYLHNEEATRRAFTPDGWFRSGDAGRLEGDGFVYLARIGDALRLRGYLVDPAEIEEHLCLHGAVAQAQVVGVALAGEGDVPVAFVRLKERGAAGEAELLEHCRRAIAGYKVPRRIVVVEEFPVTTGPNGVKIQKNRLREMASELLPAQRGGR
jgi:fatty-acyl-CoA synthase